MIFLQYLYFYFRDLKYYFIFNEIVKVHTYNMGKVKFEI